MLIFNFHFFARILIQLSNIKHTFRSKFIRSFHSLSFDFFIQIHRHETRHHDKIFIHVFHFLHSSRRQRQRDFFYLFRSRFFSIHEITNEWRQNRQKTRRNRQNKRNSIFFFNQFQYEISSMKKLFKQRNISNFFRSKYFSITMLSAEFFFEEIAIFIWRLFYWKNRIFLKKRKFSFDEYFTEKTKFFRVNYFFRIIDCHRFHNESNVTNVLKKSTTFIRSRNSTTMSSFSRLSVLLFQISTKQTDKIHRRISRIKQHRKRRRE